MYAFAQRDDFKVLDEPFYGYYLSNANLAISHPSHSEIVKQLECDEDRIVQNIEALSEESNVFIKGMAHHFLTEAPGYLLNWTNIILIRHPRKLIASFSKVIPNPTLADIGIKKASELFSYLKHHGKIPIVIDSDELMIHPERYLRKLCEAINISFSEEMLTWEKGGIPEDGIWAKHWYKNVHQTTGFKVQQNITAEVPPHLGPLLAEALPFYDTLKIHILKND